MPSGNYLNAEQKRTFCEEKKKNKTFCHKKGVIAVGRSLYHQFGHAISENMHIGESKRQYKLEHNGRVDGRIYSVQTAENLRSTAKSMSAFIREHHPEVKMVRDITNTHIQEWINDRSKHWTQRTIETQISNVKALFDRVERTYDSKMSCEPERLFKPESTKPSSRIVAMTRQDLNALQTSFWGRDATTEGRTALELSCRCGLRVKEIARLEVRNINLEKNVIEVRDGAKNGKYRDVPIRERDRAFFADLKASRMGERFICRGREEDTLNKAIRAEMRRCGIADKYKDTTNHSIRKMYARERMEEERATGKSERDAWSVVQQELGHGKNFREALYTVYIKS